MSRSVDETRREFLLKLARTVAFVPPAIATLDVRDGLAQKAPGGGGPGGGGPTAVAAPTTTTTTAPTTAPVTGSLSPPAPTASMTSSGQLRGTDETAPWNPSGSPSAPPWSRPPPTQTGR